MDTAWLDPTRLRADSALRWRWSRELHPFNRFYGHDAVLKRYAGLPTKAVLKAAIEHGLTLDDTVPALDRRLALPVYLAQSERRAAAVARAMPSVDVMAIGPMIRYAQALAPTALRSPRRRVVLFPAHSIDTAEAKFDVGEFLKRSFEVRAGYDETVACLYWRDVQLGRHRDYLKAGLACTTAGHLGSEDFLFRLLKILESAALIVTNEPGTHLAYAVLIGVPVWLVPQRVDYAMTVRTPSEVLEARNQRGAAERVMELRRLFAEPLASPSEEQMAFVRELTGDEAVQTPDRLKQILSCAEASYARWPLSRRARLRGESIVRSAIELGRAAGLPR